MADTDEQKEQIEREIERARDGVSDAIDQLDVRLRTQLDVKAIARKHAPQLIAGGAVVGFLVGFGLPKIMKRVIQVGIPLALVAYKIKQSRDGGGGGYSEV
ncbi:MAG: hypothetical protein JWO56_568 [Acidobacteria bacterium]|nr:hypothetical protein [Acidobacteriota bacterium]